MYIGKTIHTLRINKNIPSHKAYKDILSRPAIVKFEKGLADTKVNRFFQILDNLNVTLEEFEVFYLKEENKNAYYTNSYIKAYYNKDVSGLKALIEEAKKDYKKTGKESFNHYQAVISLLLSDYDKNINPEKYISTLQHYLVNCNSWGYYEVTLFTNTLPYYSDELVDIVYLKAINILHSSPNKTRYKNEFVFLICNILEVRILSKNINSAKFYLLELQKQNENNQDNIYLQIAIKFFNAITDFVLGIKNEDTITRILDIFDFLELYNEKRIYEDLYSKVKNLSL